MAQQQQQQLVVYIKYSNDGDETVDEEEEKQETDRFQFIAQSEARKLFLFNLAFSAAH